MDNRKPNWRAELRWAAESAYYYIEQPGLWPPAMPSTGLQEADEATAFVRAAAPSVVLKLLDRLNARYPEKEEG